MMTINRTQPIEIIASPVRDRISIPIPKKYRAYSFVVTFEDGTSGVFDFTPFADYPCYRPLKSEGLFSMVRADHGTLAWPGDIDIAPETVWEMGAAK